jgi:hypothetical protein
MRKTSPAHAADGPACWPSACSRWRWVIWAAAVEGVLFVLGFSGPGQMTMGDLVANPYLTLPTRRSPRSLPG